jgi:ankyrin repeat protein
LKAETRPPNNDTTEPMNDWKLQQMIKACGWPLAPELLAIGANFNARLDGGLVPLHWACAQGKAGLVKYMIQHGANVQGADDDGQTPLTMALNAGSFQVVMLVIDRLKALATPPPDVALRTLLTNTFNKGHTDARNRLLQTLKDWDRIAKKAGAAVAAPARQLL